MSWTALAAVAGLVFGAVANVPVERLPATILGDEARRMGRRWTLARRVFLAVATAGLFALAAARFHDDTLRASWSCVVAGVLLALAVVDLENQLLPDLIVVPALVAGLVVSPFLMHLDWWDGLAGAAVGFLVFLPIWGWAELTGRSGRIMGFGDLKLTAMMGATLGLQFFGVAIYAGVLLGGIIAALLIVGRSIAPRAMGEIRVMPYGTFLAAGGLIALYYGRPIMDRVLDVIG